LLTIVQFPEILFVSISITKAKVSSKVELIEEIARVIIIIIELIWFFERFLRIAILVLLVVLIVLTALVLVSIFRVIYSRLLIWEAN
jgi:hypothetical protein